MAEWVVEHGIGETRALLMDGDEVLAAKLHWPGHLSAGSSLRAKLVLKPASGNRGLAVAQDGTEILVDRVPAQSTEGSAVWLDITRAPIAERGRFKRAVGRIDTTGALEELAQRGALETQSTGFPMPEDGNPVRQLRPGSFLTGWDDIWQSASSGEVEFAGGSLLFSVTPAMTLIDVDGQGSPQTVSLAAVPALATALRQFDIGGNIGVDFPTMEAKADRQVVDAALEQALSGWSHERTAMNGFGFVQIVARLEGPSLLHRFATSRTGMCARLALRRAERAKGAGAVLLLTVHPALEGKLKGEWLQELARRTGKQVRVAAHPALALETPHAQLIAS